MINKENTILLVLILSLYVNIHGQAVVVEHNSGASAMDASIAISTLGMNNFKTTDLKYDDVKGSPYLEKDILNGFVTMIDDQRSETVPLQYDIYSNEFFHVNEKGQEMLIDMKLIKEIVLNGKEEDYKFKRINPRKPHKFYEVLYESETLDIYNDLQINFYEGKEQGITRIDPRFSRDDNYYAQVKGKEPKKIKLKKKDIYKLFGKEEQKEMDSLSKSQKIKLKKSKDFKKLFGLMQG